MPAHAGVLAATMVAAGFTGVDDVFSGERNFINAFAARPRPRALAHGLGCHYEIMDTNIKRWTVGSPMQSALDSLEWLMSTKGIAGEDVQSVAVHLPTRSSRTVDDAPMPNINAQHLVSLMLTDGTVSFASWHDMARMGDPTLLKLRRRVRVVPRDDLMGARPRRQAIVEIVTRDGRTHTRRTRAVRGSIANPMTWEKVAEKASSLMDPVLGKRKARGVVNAVSNLETLNDATRLRPLLSARSS
jgi:2-methylcitrate dehydratase PrpD